MNMNILLLLKKYLNKNHSAEIAKNRLHIIIAQQKAEKNGTDYLPTLRQEILAVIAKYTKADIEKVNIEFHRKENSAVLELNVTLPDQTTATTQKIQ